MKQCLETELCNVYDVNDELEHTFFALRLIKSEFFGDFALESYSSREKKLNKIFITSTNDYKINNELEDSLTLL